MHKKSVLIGIVLLRSILCLSNTTYSLGIGLIIQKETQRLESYNIMTFFLDNPILSKEKLNVSFAENPLTCYIYITGVISHNRITLTSSELKNYNVIVNNYKGSRTWLNAYFTKFSFQVWYNGKPEKQFIDSAIYIPSEKEYFNLTDEQSDQYPIYDGRVRLQSALLKKCHN